MSSLIGNKIYMTSLNDYNFVKFCIFKNKTDVINFKRTLKREEIKNKVQDISENQEVCIEYGTINDYFFTANYDLKSYVPEENKKPIVNINFIGFNAIFQLTLSRNNMPAYLICKDTYNLNLYGFKISGLEGIKRENQEMFKYLSIKKDNIISRFAYNNNEGFDIEYVFDLYYNNEKFKEEFERNVNPNHEKYDEEQCGFRILKNCNYAEEFKKESKQKMINAINDEFERMENQKKEIFEIIKN